MPRILFLFLLNTLLLFGTLSAQTGAEKIAKDYLIQEAENMGITQELVEQLILTDEYKTKHNGVQHLYFQQSINGIPVFNATLNILINKRNEVIVSGNRLIKGVEKSRLISSAEITPEAAINSAAMDSYPLSRNKVNPKMIQRNSASDFLYNETTVSNSDIPVKLIYHLDDDKNLVLSWNLEIDHKSKADYWNYTIDAKDGKILGRHNYTTYCTFNHGSFDHKAHSKNSSCQETISNSERNTSLLPGSGSYKVFPFPGESPNHIEHTILDSPEDFQASPFGWHDINGFEGPEFTITRGNNVHAYLDEFDQDSPSAAEPDGGDSLKFMFEFTEELEAEDNKDAAVVNLFYVNNRIHDLMYRFGFDEASGNFQANNYGNGGQENDYVNAQAFDGGGENNANFSTPGDGSNGRMQMYLWSGGDQLRLEIKDPLEISGLYETGKGNFGPDMDINLVDGKVVIAQDDTNKPNLGCGDMVNGDELTGNIALIDRGVCEFGSKVLRAEEAGSIAVLICNVEGVDGGTGDELINMAEGAEGSQVGIPSLFVKKTTCDLIKFAIADSKDVNITMGLQQIPGPASRPGSFDNGVVIHEFAHGISTRLTGGPDNSSCLYNADVNGDGNPDGEQMGEGWSDFYALAFTTKVGDMGDDARGIGTYASGQQTSGRGIRHYPYSTDMQISPVTYDYIKTTNIPHGVGEVWAAAIWDLYWEMVNLYGFDPTWTDVNSGNYKAMILVSDGLKLQTCNPGFLDGRDAILIADLINYEEDHECLIWEVFARRGMGFNAEQGDPFDHRDGKENFDSKPTCIAELKIKEEYSQLVVPGETMDITITATNHKIDSVSNVKIVEDLPDGLSYVDGSSNFSAEQNGSTLSFDLGTLQSLEEKVLNFSLKADPGIFSIQKFYDDMEEDDGNWFGLNNVGDETFWELSDLSSSSGDYSWYAAEAETTSDLSLIMLYDPVVIDGEAPALAFSHSFNTEVLTDGGFVEYSTDEGSSWNNFKSEDFVVNPYTGGLSYNTIAIPGLEAFYGDSEGFIKSYIDLSSLKGEEVIFSFRYGTDDNTKVDGDNPGWFVDDVEIVELRKYERTICIESDEGDNTCLESKIIIDSRLPDATYEVLKKGIKMAIGPNPANTFVNLYIDSPEFTNATLSILSADGKLINNKNVIVQEGEQRITLSTGGLNPGIYWLNYNSSELGKTFQLIIE